MSINKVSASLAEELALYRVIRLDYLKRFTRCRASLNGCRYWATEVHHKRGRGVYLLDLTTWLPVCPVCHHWIELHPARAKELGYSEDRLSTDIDIV